MVIDDLDLVSISVFPDEAEAPLIVDSDAVLAPAGTPEAFQPIAGRHGQIVELSSPVQKQELTPGDALESSESSDVFIFEQCLRFLALEGLGHLVSV